MGYKVIKGKTLAQADTKEGLDSTHTTLKDARRRKSVLQRSIRHPRGTKIRGRVWILPMGEDDPINYRKPISMRCGRRKD